MAAGAAAGACSRRPCHEPWKLSKRVITGNQARRQREAISSGCAASAFAFAFAALQPLVVAWLEVVSAVAVAVAVAPHAQANNQMERIKFEKGIKATKWLAIFQNTSTCVRCPISLTQRILEAGGVSPWHYRHSQPCPAGPGFCFFFSQRCCSKFLW